MQMNQALFLSSGQCGYVLQPANMRDDIFDPFDKSTLRGVEPLSISIEVSTSLKPAHGCCFAAGHPEPCGVLHCTPLPPCPGSQCQ